MRFRRAIRSRCGPTVSMLPVHPCASPWGSAFFGIKLEEHVFTFDRRHGGGADLTDCGHTPGGGKGEGEGGLLQQRAAHVARTPACL